jgi:hypothetical protein
LPLQQVHLRVNDAATGKPTPVRLRITDSAGTYYAPYGRLTEFAAGPNQDVGGNVYVGVKPWAYIDGACEILLPSGPLHIEIWKGPEYKPIDEEITLLAGTMALRLQIERWSDVRKQGWYSGDTRAHFLSPDAALLEGQAEDVAVVNLLAKETALKDAFGKTVSAIPNIVAFSGQTFARESSDCGVAVNTQNVHSELGSLGLLHCHRVVYPLTCDSGDWRLEDWCDQCHRKHGLVVWTNPLHQSADFLYGEPLADAILGKVDAFEVTFWEDSPFDVMVEYYRLLDAGLVLPLVGASGKDSNGLALGSMRTYAQLPAGEPFTYKRWIEAVRLAHTFVSNGPLLQWLINGATPASRLEVAPGSPLRVRVEAKSIVPFEQLELLWNGEVIANATPASELPHAATLEHEFPATQSGSLAASCRGATPLSSRPAPQRVFAHTSAVAVRLTGAPEWARKTVQHFSSELDRMLRWANEKARCETPAQREKLAHVFEAARTELRKKLSS